MTARVAEVVVVGAGPAGSAVSAELARRGRDVLLVDRGSFPRPKPCGECLNPGAVAALERLGLLEAVRRARPESLEGWALVTPGGRQVRATFPGNRIALGVDRTTLDRILLDEARSQGARMEENVRVVDVEPGTGDGPPSARAIGIDGTVIHLKGSVLVGADGLRSVVARRIGAIRRPPRLRKASLTWRISGRGPSRRVGRLFLADELTVGLAPVPDPEGSGDRWNATLVVNAERLAHRLTERGWALLRRALDELAAPWRTAPMVRDGPWGSGPFDWPVRNTVRGRTLLLGDAAGYYDPLTGQGIYRALRGAELAGGIIDRALPRSWEGEHALVDRKVLGTYHRHVAARFAPGRGLQRVIESVVSRSGARESALGLLERWPAAGSNLLRMTGDLI